MRTIRFKLDPGRRRPINEDHVLVDELLGFAVVADGVGGRAGGDRAARIAAELVMQVVREQEWAIEALRRARTSSEATEIAKLIRFAIMRASEAVLAEASARPELSGMSTTLTAFLDLGERGLVAHVGDSRCYLVRDERVRQLTEDHLAPAPGAMSGGDLGARRRRRGLTRAIGAAAEVQPDIFWVTLHPADCVVLCSDGLSDILAGDDELSEVIAKFGPDAAPEILVDLANARGGPDNVSAVVVGPLERSPAPEALEGWDNIREQLDTLRRLPAFSPLSYLDLEALRGTFFVDVFVAGDVVAPREAGVALGGVLMGGALGRWPDGTTFPVGAGALLGEMTLTTRSEWPYEIRATEDLVLLSFPVDEITRFIAERGRAGAVLLWSLLATANERNPAASAPDASRNVA